MTYVYNDGGRVAAGYKGSTGDCVARAIAIASELPYQEVYDRINAHAQDERITRRRKKRGRSNARTGVYKPTYKKMLADMGWVWHPTMFIGQGCTVHLRDDELPPGRLIVSVSRHLVAVIDGVINDTHDCSRDGVRCVYGFWSK